LEPVTLQLPPALVGFMAAWFFYVGGSIGSFMNDVIFRVPRGRSVVHPGSRCPACGSAIRWFDNLPVLSWFVLRGKCRDCGSPISFRYPLVELLVGVLFLALAVEGYARGEWLSTHPARLIAAYVYIALLLCTLICAAYIAWDGQRVPARLFAPALVIGSVLPALWNEIRPLGATVEAGWLSALWQAWTAGLLVALCGAVLGGLYDWARGFQNSAGQPRGRVSLCLITIGWLLGWPPVLLAAVVGSFIALVWPWLFGRRWQAASAAALVGITGATVLLALAGSVVFPYWLDLSRGREWLLLAAGGAVVLLLGSATRWLDPPDGAASPFDSSPDVIYP
jgi:leader peptidase (prepilin peptidase)/N-methyltransferase